MLWQVGTRGIAKAVSNSSQLRLVSSRSYSAVVLARRANNASNSHGFAPRSLLTSTATFRVFSTSTLRRHPEGDKRTDPTPKKTPPAGVLNQPDPEPNPPAGKPSLTPHPERVSLESSIRPSFEVGGTPTGKKDPKANEAEDIDMGKSLRQDLGTIRDTFALREVPREAYVLGLAGVLPYAATSLATVFCAWDINHAENFGTGVLLSESSAETVLHLLEPLQIGYGAVIISFLGAIHWGLEWAGYGGYKGYRRYAIGVLAPAVAWPTLLLPIEGALVTQFIAFTFLYYADVRATARGWTPPWYGTYRFVLTFLVGATIVISLIGRGEIADRVKRLPSALDRIMAEGEGDSKRANYESKKSEMEAKKKGTEV